MSTAQAEWVRAQVEKAPPLPESVARLLGERLAARPVTEKIAAKTAA